MNLEKKIVFIGARFNVLEQLLKIEDQHAIKIYALQNSYLSNILDTKKIEYESFTLKDKKQVLSALLEMPFDVLVSNGCPFILPTQKFAENQILINIHPTYLPYLQGKTPINGVFYEGYDFYGATMHYMDEGIDTGAIIHQEKKMLTPDIDLGLLYYLSMKLEGTVFSKGWQQLKSVDFAHSGKPQQGKGSYFNRTPEMQQLDFTKDTHEHLLKSIKSFGIGSQGCTTQIEGVTYQVFDAEEIMHKPLLEQFETEPSGSIVLAYDGKILVKTREGLLKITRFKKA